ncbi:CYIR protein, partial [Plasmodium cynomolgi strain B]
DLFLNGSSKYGLYNKFTRDDIYDVDTRYCKLHKSNLNVNQDIYNLCKMYEKNLGELPKIMKTEEDSKQHCRYLTFWINDRIRNNFKTHNVPMVKQNIIIQKFLSVSHLVNKDLSDNQCKYIHNRNIDFGLWKNWKDLYDYIRNKDNIPGKIKSNERLCKIYQEYYAHIENIYENYKNECCPTEIRKCPKGIHFNEWCSENNILTKLECEYSQKVTEDLEESSKIDSAHPAGEEDSRTNSAIAEIALYSQGRSIHNGDITSDKTNDYIIPSVVFSVVAASSLLFLLYKFTTVGSMINSKILRRKINNNNFNEHTLSFLSDYPDNIHFDSRNDGFHVSYQPD